MTKGRLPMSDNSLYALVYSSDAIGSITEGALQRADDPARVLRALSELTLWFHVRAMRA